MGRFRVLVLVVALVLTLVSALGTVQISVRSTSPETAPPPLPTTFAGWLERAEAEYWAAPKGEPPWRKEYPARVELLAYPAEVLTAVEARLCTGGEFWIDLLASLERETAQRLVRPRLDDASCLPFSTLGLVVPVLFDQNELKDLALTLSGPGRFWAYRAVKGKDLKFQYAMAAQPRNQEPWLLREMHEEVLQAVWPQLTPATRLDWLQQRAAPDWVLARRDPEVEQELLYRQGRFAELMAAVDRDGAGIGNWFWRTTEWEKKMVAEYPASFYARGIRAYEAVRGETYFNEERQMAFRGRLPMFEFGNRLYNLDREIPGWLAFLATYSRHPAADDAAYRLARSYEFRGQHAEALRWLVRALELPDGELSWQARGRIAWILDAVLSEEALERLAAADAVPALRPHIEYSLALRRLRAFDFAGAVARLDTVVEAYGNRLIYPTAERSREPFRLVAAAQRGHAAALAGLAARPEPEARYALGAYMFHTPELFASRLWDYGKGNDHFAGHAFVAMRGDMEPQFSRWAAESNRFVQAARVFAQLEGAPEAVAARAAYSRALSLAKLVYPGTYINLWRAPRELSLEAADLFEAMARRFPESDLADDALLSVAYLRRDLAYFDRIVAEYPNSDMAADARLREFPPYEPYPLEAPPYRFLTPGEAPPEVAAWAAAQQGAGKPGALEFGGYTYVLTTVNSFPWYSVGVPIKALADGTFRVTPAEGKPEWAMIRFHAVPGTVTVAAP